MRWAEGRGGWVCSNFSVIHYSNCGNSLWNLAFARFAIWNDFHSDRTTPSPWVREKMQKQRFKLRFLRVCMLLIINEIAHCHTHLLISPTKFSVFSLLLRKCSASFQCFSHRIFHFSNIVIEFDGGSLSLLLFCFPSSIDTAKCQCQCRRETCTTTKSREEKGNRKRNAVRKESKKHENENEKMIEDSFEFLSKL